MEWNLIIIKAVVHCCSSVPGRDIVLCSWARHFTLTEPCDGLASHPGGIRNTPGHFMLLKPG